MTIIKKHKIFAPCSQSFIDTSVPNRLAVQNKRAGAKIVSKSIGQNHFEGTELNDELERFGDWRRRRRKS